MHDDGILLGRYKFRRTRILMQVHIHDRVVFGKQKMTPNAKPHHEKRVNEASKSEKFQVQVQGHHGGGKAKAKGGNCRI